MKTYNEQTFEAYIESAMQDGWTTVANSAFDAAHALFPEALIAFLRNSQPALWAELEKLNGELLPGQILGALVKERALKGTLHILRHGFKYQASF
jgi:type I restriction enzyme R subunit